MTYDYQDADGFERGRRFNGSKTKRIYRLRVIVNNVAEVSSRDIFGKIHIEFFPTHTVVPLETLIIR